MRIEGDVKKAVKELLTSYGAACWFFMPVSLGMGVHGIPDFLGVYYGLFFCIETKRPGRRGEKNGGLSGLQVKAKKLIEAAGGKYFIVDDEETCVGLRVWFDNDYKEW